MQQEIATPVDLKVLMNHIYEYKKGVRRLGALHLQQEIWSLLP